MSWAQIIAAIKMGLVASAESVANIISGVTKVGNADKLDGNDSSYFATKASVTNITNGTTKVGNADKLDGNDSTYFATAASVTNIVNGTTTVGNADKLDGLDSTKFPRYYTHTTDYNGGTNGNKVDFNALTQVGFHLMAGNFSESPNRPNGFYGDSSVIVTGNSACLTQIVVVGDTICFRKNAWNGDFGEWQYGGNADTVDGFQASSFRGKGTNFTYEGKNGGNLDDYQMEYHGFVFNMSNTPSGFLYGFLDIDVFSGGGFTPTDSKIVVRQTLSSWDSEITWRRTYNANTKIWSGWKKFSFYGDSAPVVVSATAPTDTTAVWIVPN